MLGFQEGVGASHTSLIINPNLYIRIVEYSIKVLINCDIRKYVDLNRDKRNTPAMGFVDT